MLWNTKPPSQEQSAISLQRCEISVAVKILAWHHPLSRNKVQVDPELDAEKEAQLEMPWCDGIYVLRNRRVRKFNSPVNLIRQSNSVKLPRHDEHHRMIGKGIRLPTSNLYNPPSERTRNLIAVA